jgi:hypothetical protein
MIVGTQIGEPQRIHIITPEKIPVPERPAEPPRELPAELPKEAPEPVHV